jgi:hypothetical protein
LGGAIIKNQFRGLLFDKPAEALSGFELTDAVHTGLQKIKHEDFEGMISELEKQAFNGGVSLGTAAMPPNLIMSELIWDWFRRPAKDQSDLEIHISPMKVFMA